MKFAITADGRYKWQVFGLSYFLPRPIWNALRRCYVHYHLWKRRKDDCGCPS